MLWCLSLGLTNVLQFTGPKQINADDDDSIVTLPTYLLRTQLSCTNFTPDRQLLFFYQALRADKGLKSGFKLQTCKDDSTKFQLSSFYAHSCAEYEQLILNSLITLKGTV